MTVLPSKSDSIVPTMAVLAAVLLWGGSFAAMKTALADLPPYAMVFGRLAVGSLAMLVLGKRLRLGRPRKRDLPALAALALLQPCLYFFFEAKALTFTTSAQAGVISAFVPLLVSLGAWLFLGESLSGRNLAGLGLAVVGVVVLSLLAETRAEAPEPLLGNALELCAMACAAAYMLLLKRLSSRYSPLGLTALQTVTGLLFFLPWSGPLFARDFAAWSGSALVSLLYLGVGVTLGAFGLYNWGLSRMPAGRGAAFINLVPVAAASLGWLILGESQSPGQIAAALAVVLGVALSQSRPNAGRSHVATIQAKNAA